MSRTSLLISGLIASSSTWILAQSGIEPPRRAVPPPSVTDAAAVPAADAPAAVPTPVPVPEPATPAPQPTETKPAGLTPAQIEAMKARARGVRNAGPAGTGTSASDVKSALGTASKTGKAGTGGTSTNPNSSGVPLSEVVNEKKPSGALLNKDAFSDNSASTTDDGYVDVFANPTATVEDVLEDYEKFTGVTVVRAGNITGNVPIQVNPAAKMKKDEYVDYLKVALMINGFGIHEYTPKLHIITVTGTASPFFPTAPPPEGHAVFTRAVDLPEQEVFVNYFMKFDYISVQDATTILGAPQHQSGKITAVPNAGGILITESVPVVRSMIAIKEKIDVPSGEVDRRFVQLKLADAEEIAQIIQQIIQQQNTANKGGSGGGTKIINPSAAAAQLTTQLNPGAPMGGAPATGAAAVGAQTAPDGASVVVQADRRTNRILLSGKKSDIIYMEKLIKDFDVASEVSSLETYQLRYISVVDFIDLATGALEARGFGTSSGGTSGGAGASRQAGGNGYAADPRSNPGGSQMGGSQMGGTNRSSTSSSRNGSSSSSRNGSLGGSAGGGGRSGGSSRGGGAGSGNTLAGPTSTTVGKTLLISDPQSNSIIVSGPPESREQIHLLIQEIDKHPRQVHIDCVIAEITVGDRMEFGLDLLRKVDNINLGGKSVDVAGLFRNTSTTGGIIDPAALTTISSFPAAASGLNTYFQVGELINGYVNATEGTSRIKILQKPSIAMANNETGYISVGKQVPYSGSQQSSINNGTNNNNTGQTFNSTVEFKEVLLSLEVTPLISSRNEVSLQINQTNDNIAGNVKINGNDTPSTTTQELTTRLIVPNGGIAILGGLTADSRSNNNDGAPFLSRIPILKEIFGHSKKDDSRREIMIFIQPRIMETSSEMIDVNAKEIQRNIVGPAAENFIHPEYNTSDILLPQDAGNTPFDNAGYPQQEEKPGFWKRLGNTFRRKTSVPPESR